MLVSEIRQSSPGRFKITLENGEVIKSTLSALTDLRLSTGKDLDEDELQEVRLQSMRALSRERALEMASRRVMSCREMHDKLMQKGADEETADYCTAWLEDMGFLNDESCAAAVVRHYAGKGYGRSRVKAELIRRGISGDISEAALENMPQQDDKIDKFISSRLHNRDDRDEIRKISASLYRRGYSWQEIRAAFERLDAEIEEY